MNNISLNSEAINLEIGAIYIIIDPLYIMDIKDNIEQIDEINFLAEIREKVFPYTDSPFIEYKALNKVFNVNQIKKIITESDITKTISTDTGLLLFINSNYFYDFIKGFNYDELINENNELINIKYWKSITSKYAFESFGLILSEGISSNLEFDGSGTYIIE